MKIKLTQKEVNRAKLINKSILKKAAPVSKQRTLTCELVGTTIYIYHPKVTIRITKSDMNRFAKWILEN